MENEGGEKIPQQPKNIQILNHPDVEKNQPDVEKKQEDNKPPFYSESQSSLNQNKSSRSHGSKSNSSVSYGQGEQNKSEKMKDESQKPKQMPKKIRYKYCCKICKHTDSSKKACVCVVPKGQRRTQIGCHGCQTCGCNGCSKEDFTSRGQDPEYHPGDKKKTRRQKQHHQFEARNGCCRNCMKAFSKNNKSCLCQVPQNVRNTKLPSSGCKICGCFGCNPEDKKQGKNKKQVKKDRERERQSRSRQKKKKRRQQRKQRSESSNSREYIDSSAMNFNNIDRSAIGSMMVSEYRIDPALLGFGVPQRSYTYLTGKPK